MPVTIRDVAKRLGLSVTTVSRALAGYDDVADATRERVIQTAEDMGYTPSHAARQLRRKRTDTIGLIFPTLGNRFSDPFFSEFMAGVGDQASQNNYDLLVSVAPPGEDERNAYQRWVQSRRVDGFILVRIRRTDWRIQYLSENKFPFMSFGRSQTVNGAPHIGVDGKSGMLELTRHMIEMGHRRIAFIGASQELTLSRDRMEGYLSGLKEAGITPDPDLVLVAQLTRSTGHASALQLLQLQDPPTAIIGINDLTALGAMRAAQELGLNIGRELAIAGFDGTEAGEHATPPLTTVAQPVYQIGSEACATLIELINNGQHESVQQLVKPTLIIRRSTQPDGVNQPEEEGTNHQASSP